MSCKEKEENLSFSSPSSTHCCYHLFSFVIFDHFAQSSFFMSGSVSTPTLSVNMHLLPITSPADVSPGKYTNSSTSPSFASVVSSSAGSSSASPHLLYQHQQHGQTSPHSIKNTAPTRSPAHSSSAKYDSALASPASRTIQSSNAPDQSGSDSSEVEIYLNSLVLHDSVSRNYLVPFFCAYIHLFWVCCRLQFYTSTGSD